MNIVPYLQSGDSAAWTDQAQILGGQRYDSTSYALTYSLRGPSALDLDAAQSGSGWLTTLTTTQSAALLPGPYRWAAYLTATDIRVTAGQGDMTVGQNLQTLPAGQSALTFYEQALADTESALAAYAQAGGQPIEWQVGQNRYRFNALPEIQSLAAYWRSCVLSEKTNASIGQGQGNPRKLFARFVA